MNCSFLIALLLWLLLAFTVVAGVILLIAYIFCKEKRKTLSKVSFFVFSPAVAVFSFFLSILIYDYIIAGLTSSSSLLSDEKKTCLNEHFYISGNQLVTTMSVYDNHTDRELLHGVDSLYLDGNAVVAASWLHSYPHSYALYRFDYVQGQSTREQLFTCASEGDLWSRYVTENGIDRNQVRDIRSVYEDNTWWHLLVSFALAVLTSVFSVIGLMKWLYYRHK